MTEEIDFNKIIVEFVNQNIDKFYILGKSVFKEASDKIKIELRSSYNDYLSCVTEKYSKSKSFFIRHEPTYLYSFYIPLGLCCGKRQIEEASSSQLSSISQFAVITGSAGIGKSMIMRHLFLEAISLKEQVPIFIELRALNLSSLTLIEHIQNILSYNHFLLDNEYIEKALEAGHFIILIDGFDEVAPALRKSVSTQIQDLANNYDKNTIIVSSRPDSVFSGWQLFTIYEVAQLTLEKACKLVEKLPFDNELKIKFLKDLKEALFEKHRSFLSNPLLLSIMLLTYELSADIPNKTSIFYQQAYEALFQRHDALKGGYQRERLCDIDIQDFSRVFAAFSIQSYDQHRFQFTNVQAIKYINNSKKLLALDFDTNHYLTDALQAVCLLLEDGLMINFAHRSFQEYFAACFISDAKFEVQQKLINRYRRGGNRDNVLKLLYEMKPELVERAYFIPMLDKLEQVAEIKTKFEIDHYVRLIEHEVDYFELKMGILDYVAFHTRSYGFFEDVFPFILGCCGHLVDWPGYTESLYESRTSEHSLSEYDDGIVSTDLTLDDSFIQALASGQHEFSMQHIAYVMKIKKALLSKHQRAEHSLSEILDM